VVKARIPYGEPIRLSYFVSIVVSGVRLLHSQNQCACAFTEVPFTAIAANSSSLIELGSLDVTNPVSVQAAAAELDSQAIDLLLNNAGAGGRRGQTIGNIDYEDWMKVLDVNTMGPMRVSEAFVDHVARSERKLIVILTSGMGSLADNTSGGSFAYRSSKAAVNMVMRSLSIDLAPRGITCVVVNPGWVQTDMGGSHATLTTVASVTMLRRLIDTLGPAQSGKFFNYDGREYAW
jgi:NAD(P)-dependent dehydrogenase (short-subunit alcohol dehydrogenase family)